MKFEDAAYHIKGYLSHMREEGLIPKVKIIIELDVEG